MDRNHRIAEALAAEAIADAVEQGDPYAVRHRVQVTSLGGSGTTSLTASFVEAGLDLPKGPGEWPHKHLRTPPTGDEVPPGFRVVYPISDPRDAVLSIFRRGIQAGHWRWLNLPHDGEPPAALDDLESFLEGGVDEFGLTDHLERWIDHPPGYPVMFVRFDRIDEAWDELAEFVGLPAGHPPVSYQARASDWRSEAEWVRTRIDEIYGDLAERIESFPAARVV